MPWDAWKLKLSDTVSDLARCLKHIGGFSPLRPSNVNNNNMSKNSYSHMGIKYSMEDIKA